MARARSCFTYLGSRAKLQLLPSNPGRELPLPPRKGDLFDRFRRTERFIDITAGSNNIPFALARCGLPVCVNDACYYSHCIARGLFHRKEPTNLDEVQDVLGFTQKNKFKKGLMQEVHPHSGKRPHVTEICAFLDSWIQNVHKLFTGGDQGFLLACTGSSILRFLTFHGGSWSETEGISVPRMARAILKKATAANHFLASGCSVFGNASDFVTTHDHFDGASVSADPAWPWIKGKNPYHLFQTLGDFLLQKKTPEYIWPENAVEKVLDDVSFWIRRSLERGAAEFFLWNQTTNTPDKPSLVQYLQKQFHVEEVALLQARSGIGKADFEDYVLWVW